MLTILFYVYAIGFIVYFVRNFIENYNSWEEVDDNGGVVGRLILTAITTLMIGSIYALAWPVIWYMETKEKEKHEASKESYE
jgi:hypothetical protein